MDQWLESVLSQYCKAEPRSGLENRVLATLQAEQNRIAPQRPWWWAIGTATALAGVVAAIWIGENTHDKYPRSAARTSMTREQEFRSSTQPGATPQVAHAADSYEPGRFPAKHIAKRIPAQRPTRDLASANPPKLSQFPSPAPLSQQEQILMSFVAQHPEKAARVAQAVAEARQQDLEEEAKAANDSM